jgi:uncharacterized RDD family membrane protein YckC
MTQNYEPSGKGRRFLTFLVDYIGVLALGFVAGAIVGIVWGEAGVQYFEGVRGWFFGALIYFAYYFVCEDASARTPGKRAAGTMVIDVAGGRPTSRQIALRSLSRLIPFEPFSVLLNDDAVGWHDSLSKTRVVMYRERPQATPG